LEIENEKFALEYKDEDYKNSNDMDLIIHEIRTTYVKFEMAGNSKRRS
jgi:hypothetical protein